MHFLSADLSFEPDLSVSPLESALALLQDMKQDCHIAEQDYEKVCSSVKEMVGVYIVHHWYVYIFAMFLSCLLIFHFCLYLDC